MFARFALLGWLAIGSASSAHAALFGHNVSPTSYTLSSHEVDLGSYVAGYGVTDNLTIATSPWMIVNYNMPTIGARYAFTGDEILQRFAFEFDYFKTMPYGFNWYTQESMYLRLVGTHRFSPHYTAHFNVGYQYFFNADRPYSLRQIYGEENTTATAGILHEISINSHYGIFLEDAILGMNYPVPFLHLGASAFMRERWGEIQLGLSRTMLMGTEGWYRHASSQTWIYEFQGGLHPEIQVQFRVN